MKTHAVVTGGAGFIGSHLVDQLLLDYQRVTVVDDFSTGKIENLKQALSSGSVTVIRKDITDFKALENFFSGSPIETVFHLATHCVRSSLSDPQRNHEVNATGTLYLLMQSLKHRVKKFVYCSSSEVFGNQMDQSHHKPLKEDDPKRPTTIYGSSKLTGELYSRAYFQTYGLPVWIVRPFNAYGPRSHIEGKRGEVIPRFFLLCSEATTSSSFWRRKANARFYLCHRYSERNHSGLRVFDIAW